MVENILYIVAEEKANILDQKMQLKIQLIDMSEINAYMDTHPHKKKNTND